MDETRWQLFEGMGAMQVKQMLAEYTELLTQFGPDSKEATEYLSDRAFNSEFAELAELARNLKKALTAPLGRRRACV